MERADLCIADGNFVSGIVAERRGMSGYFRWVFSQGDMLSDRYTCMIEIYTFVSCKLGNLLFSAGWALLFQVVAGMWEIQM